MTSFPKKEIVRFVASDGKLVIDLTGKLNGRGVYLCRSIDCFDAAVKKRRWAHALGVSPTQDEIVGLRDEYAKLIDNAEVDE